MYSGFDAKTTVLPIFFLVLNLLLPLSVNKIVIGNRVIGETEFAFSIAKLKQNHPNFLL